VLAIVTRLREHLSHASRQIAGNVALCHSQQPSRLGGSGAWAALKGVKKMRRAPLRKGGDSDECWFAVLERDQPDPADRIRPVELSTNAFSLFGRREINPIGGAKGGAKTWLRLNPILVVSGYCSRNSFALGSHAPAASAQRPLASRTR